MVGKAKSSLTKMWKTEGRTCFRGKEFNFGYFKRLMPTTYLNVEVD